MSWSSYRTGTRDAVKRAVSADLDRAAGNYPGQKEAEDILAAKHVILASIDGLHLEATPEHPTPGVKVEASGSDGIYSMGLRINVDVVMLELDAPKAAALPDQPPPPPPHET